MYKVKCLPILIVACWISYISLFCTHIVMFNVVHSINHQTLFSFFFTIFKTDHHDTVMYLTKVISSLLPLFVSLEQYLKHIKWNTCALPLCFFIYSPPSVRMQREFVERQGRNGYSISSLPRRLEAHLLTLCIKLCSKLSIR